MSKKLLIDDKKLKWLCAGFVERAKQEGYANFKTIVLVTRGGLIPGYHVATGFGIKDIRTISVSSYTGEVGDQIVEHHYADLSDTDDILVFDELTDRGYTLMRIKEKLSELYPNKNIKYGVLYKYHHSEFKPDIYFAGKSDEWLDFYYEQPTEMLGMEEILEVLQGHFK